MNKRFLRTVLLCVLITLLAVPMMAQEEDIQRNRACVEPLAIPIGSEVTIIGGMYIRSLADIDSGIVAYTPGRIAATVIGGPSCADGYNWWQVERVAGDPIFKGWVAEGRPARQYLFVNEPESDELACPAPLNAQVNQAVSVYRGLRVREEPTTESRTLTITQPDESALILGASVCAEGYNWWPVRVEDDFAIYEGWMVEGFPYLEENRSAPLYINVNPDAGPESIECGTPSPLQVGATGILRFNGSPLKALRASPTTSGELLYSLPSGIQLQILSGPFCNEGVNWRQVRVAAGSVQAEGWMAEGTWMGRFLGANNEDYDQPAP